MKFHRNISHYNIHDYLKHPSDSSSDTGTFWLWNFNHTRVATFLQPWFFRLYSIYTISFSLHEKVRMLFQGTVVA